MWISTLSRLVLSTLNLIALGSVLAVGLIVVIQSEAAEETTPDDYPGHLVLLPGERLVLGTVEEIVGGMIRVNIGELEPRFLSIKRAVEQGEWPIKKGDRVEIAVSAENLVVDYHPVNAPGWHRMIKGRLAQPLIVGYGWAVIRMEGGKEEAYAVRPLARLKMAAMPIDVPALFLIEETNQILDATFGNEQDLQDRAQEWKRAVPTAPDRQLEGTMVKPPTIVVTIRGKDGKEQQYEVRPFVEERLANVPQNGDVILLLDGENKVTDIAVPPGKGN
jgi:hypothetical protein